jgi:hemerythrin
MPIMEWSDALSVNIKEIDDQHKKLIGMINTLHDSMRAGKGKQELEKTLKELAGYASTHFQLEEKYMQKFNFPGYLGHKGKHDAFVKKITDFERDFEANRLGLSLEVMKFLKDWLVDHIQGTDRGYSETFIRGGVK